MDPLGAICAGHPPISQVRLCSALNLQRVAKSCGDAKNLILELIVNEADIVRHVVRSWPRIRRVLAAHPLTVLKRRPASFSDETVFRALLLYAWNGLPVRDSLGADYPCGPVLHRRWQTWRDAGALKPMVGEFVASLPRANLKAWRERLEDYDRQVRAGNSRNPAMSWLMINRFWYEAVALPFIETGKTG